MFRILKVICSLFGLHTTRIVEALGFSTKRNNLRFVSDDSGDSLKELPLDGVDQTNMLFTLDGRTNSKQRDYIILQILDLNFFTKRAYSNSSAAIR